MRRRQQIADDLMPAYLISARPYRPLYFVKSIMNQRAVH